MMICQIIKCIGNMSNLSWAFGLLTSDGPGPVWPMCSGSLLSHEMERRNQTKVHALFSSQIPNSSIAQAAAAAAANPSLATAANPSVALPRRRCEPSSPKPRLRVHPPASTPPRRCRARGVVRSPRSGGGRLCRGGGKHLCLDRRQILSCSR
uniref:Uncharacterized protein n=1 Tax=Oryza glumipatula TaxID=40148 RepID=A0A0D9YMR6_9ORYZ